MTNEWSKQKIDPGHRLDSEYINPNMRDAAIAALNEAVAEGIHPIIHPETGGYRTPKIQSKLHEQHPKGAASEGSSAHQLGLAFDVSIIDEHGKLISEPRHAGDDFDRLTKIMREHGFHRGAVGDEDHFQYQPGITSRITPKGWRDLRDWANHESGKAATHPGSNQTINPLEYIWRVVGAGGQVPPGVEPGQTLSIHTADGLTTVPIGGNPPTTGTEHGMQPLQGIPGTRILAGDVESLMPAADGSLAAAGHVTDDWQSLMPAADGSLAAAGHVTDDWQSLMPAADGSLAAAGHVTDDWQSLMPAADRSQQASQASPEEDWHSSQMSGDPAAMGPPPAE
jgi:hypothetical protein